MPAANAPFGFINAHKPKGITSTAFGSRVRRALGRVALGHWGTLDPDATGVLVLAVGHATRLIPLLGDGRKTYAFDVVLGLSTATGDASGSVVTSAVVADGWRDALPGVLDSIVGPLSQVPPMYSAVKVDGQPLYKSARRGEEVDRPARDVEVYELRTLDCGVDRARLIVTCSSGTYVRTLCEEIGRRLAVPAHMDALVRTAAGPFSLESAIGVDAILAEPIKYIIDPLDILTQPRVVLSDDDAARFAHGNPIVVSCETKYGEALVTLGGRMIGTAIVCAADDNVLAQPSRVFAENA